MQRGKRIKNLEGLKAVALCYAEGSSVEVKNRGTEEVTHWSATPRSDSQKIYHAENGAVIFYDDGCYYVVPYKVNVFMIMAGNGFKDEPELKAPFDNFSYPVEQQNEWEELLEDKNAALEGFFAILNPTLLNAYSYQIPEEGQDVITHDGYTFYKPLDAKYIGCYNVCESRIAFVTHEGKTYVSPYVEKFVKELEDKGYEKCENMWVPYAHDDRPLLTTYLGRYRWKSVFGDE